jgi:hypothetical protein
MKNIIFEFRPAECGEDQDEQDFGEEDGIHLRHYKR